MRIVCPACEAVYEVPGAMLQAPRLVRCARCGREWLPSASGSREATMADPPPDASLLDAPAASLAERAAAPSPMAVEAGRIPVTRVPVAPPPPSDPMLTVFPPLVDRPERTDGRTVGIAWAASLVLVLLLLSGAYVWRAELQAAWPPIQRAYAAIGLR